MAAREIIVLSNVKRPGTDVYGTVALWLSTPASLIYSDPTRTSAVPTQAPWSLTQAELQAIQDGTVTEQLWSGQVPANTLQAMKTYLQNVYSAAQAALTASAPTTTYDGTFWDGVTWTINSKP